jgi:hypothetical protein
MAKADVLPDTYRARHGYETVTWRRTENRPSREGVMTTMRRHRIGSTSSPRSARSSSPSSQGTKSIRRTGADASELRSVSAWSRGGRGTSRARGTRRRRERRRGVVSPNDLQCQLRRATARDEICDLVPVDQAGERVGKCSVDTETPQLLGTPVVDEEILVAV